MLLDKRLAASSSLFLWSILAETSFSTVEEIMSGRLSESKPITQSRSACLSCSRT